jgi:hypothetical protein
MKKNTVRLVLGVPDEVQAFLAEQALYHGSTLGAEVSRYIRAVMEATAATKKDRVSAAPE